MPKEDWERTHEAQPVELDLQAVNELVRPALAGQRVTGVERIGVGLSNTNFKLRLAGTEQPCVLRLYRGDGDIACKELAIAQLVRDSVPVADFLYMDTSCSAADKPWAILAWKEGFLLRDVRKSGSPQDIASAAASVASTLASIHSYATPDSGFFGGDLRIAHPLRMDGERFLAFIEHCLFVRGCGQWLGEELAQALWTFSQTYSHVLSEAAESPNLVHSDYNGLNILMKLGPYGYEVSAVLDWEDAFSWNRYADIGNLLRYEAEGSIFEHHFIQAYKEQGVPLQTNWRLISKLEDLVALVDMLSSSTADTPNRVQDLRQLIACIVTR
ncbi:phosphotransferase family protein [Paenibacillus aestuarii]|uniref:Aminoglycoside phosphotransferase family protein n=1 Tax=Paenibacillus aestuarii TaxID=516965 RepID=A0ABW0KHJ6_9BACL|nr:aminoglycoside phosphotransferase family protein [Paenibacillus aestuarii]